MTGEGTLGEGEGRLGEGSGVVVDIFRNQGLVCVLGSSMWTL